MDDDPSALIEFRATLDAHGTWVEDGAYGTVWMPAVQEVGPDFVPYMTAGHWVYESDYVWVSDYPWGWVPFHYGRWVLIPGRGWAWIPGREYADAWVVWRIGDEADFDCVGWAPLPPTWVWREGVAVGIVLAPPAPYVYCRRHELFEPFVARHVVRDHPVEIERRTHGYAPPGTPVARPGIDRRAPSGPPPSLLRIEPSRVAHPAPRDPGLSVARQYAAPSSARALGARPPALRAPPPAVRASPPAATREPVGRPPLGTTAPQPSEPARRVVTVPAPAAPPSPVHVPSATAPKASSPHAPPQSPRPKTVPPTLRGEPSPR